MATRGRKPFANRKAAFQNPTEEKGVHPTILKQARKTGQLNLSGRNLSTGDDFNSSLIQPLDHIYYNNTDHVYHSVLVSYYRGHSFIRKAVEFILYFNDDKLSGYKSV